MNIETIIRKVSLYRSGCTLTREGGVSLSAGTQACRIEGLTSGASTDSVRIRTSEGCTASGVQVMYPDEEEQKKRTEEIDGQIALCDARMAAVDTQEALWKENIRFPKKENAELDLLLRYADLLPEKLEECAKKKAQLKKEKEQLLKQREEIEKKISRPYVTVLLTAEKEGTYYVQAEYNDYSASWNPVYEIRAEGEEDPLLLRLRAAMRQNTGEDWKDVPVTLYTGNPSVSGNIPVLPETHLKFREEVKYARMASAPMAKNMMLGAASAMMDMAMADGATAEMSFEEAAMTSAEVNEGETMTEYVLPGVWSIVSDSSDVMADLNRKEIPCSYHVVSVPKKDAGAYLAAEVKTADLEDILNSSASVYLKGTYAGDVMINADLTKETYDLSLGKDETVKVKREQKKKYTSSVLLKGQTKTEYVYEITVVSNKKKDCRITVIDQIPVSDEKTIIVDKGELSGGKLNEESGEVKWDLTMKPQEKKVFTLSWTVSWPKDKKITETAVSSGSRFCPECGARVFGQFCPECGARVL
ncbi:MAG: mucoidy inhibitor MuiA family protein [Solobacterium sp.]|nr:mucoidy inhibitor MuiA family protein [Solobacterium sp.]